MFCQIRPGATGCPLLVLLVRFEIRPGATCCFFVVISPTFHEEVEKSMNASLDR